MPKLLTNNNVFFYYCDIHKEMSMTVVVGGHLDWDFLEKWRHIKIKRRSQFYTNEHEFSHSRIKKLTELDDRNIGKRKMSR